MSDENIFPLAQFVQRIVSRLPLPEQQEHLRGLLKRIEQGDIEAEFDLDDAVRELPQPVRAWLEEKSVSFEWKQRGMETLPGKVSLLPASQRWVCPIAECDEDEPVLQEGEDPPKRPNHPERRMIRAPQKGGAHAG
ncbi:hypothetical protein [Anaerolinea sp.]|uniref:hypothetical protein n=1 Tax=Anaerolinea sp. TaxID=1872519 RepID=UPI002ACEB4DF|nr:hypothetical protein [Anaerolinea sp.]